jgi:recombination protein RecA
MGPSRGKVDWTLETLTGRFVEVSAGAAGSPLTIAFRMVLEAQRKGEPVAWITRRDSTFYPPDAASTGVDLAVLPVVRVANAAQAAGVADLLLRSGAFTLVVLDLGPRPELSIPAQTRLVGLAKQHDTALLCLTEKGDEQASLGSLVSLRAHTDPRRREGERYRCAVRVLKDKRRGPGWAHAEVVHGPDGLC